MSNDLIDPSNLLLTELEALQIDALKEAQSRGMKILYISCVGSHMWGMENEESDIDLVMIYVVPTRRILRGEKFPATIRQEMAAREGGIYDTLGWEIGHLIDLLIKGNVNAIWYATSPLVSFALSRSGGAIGSRAGQPLPGELSFHKRDGGKPDQIRDRAA